MLLSVPRLATLLGPVGIVLWDGLWVRAVSPARSAPGGQALLDSPQGGYPFASGWAAWLAKKTDFVA